MKNSCCLKSLLLEQSVKQNRKKLTQLLTEEFLLNSIFTFLSHVHSSLWSLTTPLQTRYHCRLLPSLTVTLPSRQSGLKAEAGPPCGNGSAHYSTSRFLLYPNSRTSLFPQPTTLWCPSHITLCLHCSNPPRRIFLFTKSGFYPSHTQSSR